MPLRNGPLELFGGGIKEGFGGIVLGGVCMSTSKRACGPAGKSRGKSSRNVLPHYFLGSVAVAGLVLGCAWTVYTNVIGASIYPTVGSAAPILCATLRTIERGSLRCAGTRGETVSPFTWSMSSAGVRPAMLVAPKEKP